MKKSLKLMTLLFIMGRVLLGSQLVGAQDKKTVMTTFYPVYFLTQKIAGDAMNVEMLLDDGQEAHGYEATAQDLVKIQDADLFIYQDDEMEFFVKDMINMLDQKRTAVLESTKDIELLSGEGHDHGHDEADHGHDEADHGHDEADHGHDEADHGHDEVEHGHDEAEHNHEFDPHTWLDPEVYSQQAENIKNALIELDPANKATYEQNAKSLTEELAKISQEYKEGLKDLDNRTIVVQHGAFGYLAHAFDLEQASITGLSTNQEPSAQTIAKMQEFMKETGNKVIFVDPSMKSDISKTVGEATGAKLLPLRTLEIVTAEEMEKGLDYFTIMRDNLEVLKQNK